MSNNYRDELIKRIEECQVVIGEIEGNSAWKILLKDMQLERARLDDNWQNILDDKKLKEARILKLAIMHLITLVEKYKHDLKASQSELEALAHPDEEIHRDWDNEGVE